MPPSILFACTWFLSLAVVASTTCSKPDITESEPFRLHAYQNSALGCHGQTDIYCIRPAPGKGLGVYALRDLAVGTVIMREAPVLKVNPPKHLRGTAQATFHMGKVLREEFSRLSAEAQDEIMGLSYYGTREEMKSSDQLVLIFQTNAYKTGEEIGLFPKISRINHSCRPNTSYYWSAEANARVMYANREIRKGEEILDSYIPLLLPQEQRRKLLKLYGFTCSCAACAVDEETKKASDRRRMDMKHGFAELIPLLNLTAPSAENGKRKASNEAKLSAKMVDLAQEEGLADYYAPAYRAAALCHARAEDWERATVWAHKGYERRVLEDPSSLYALEMQQLTSKFIERWKSDLRSNNMLKDGL